MEREQVEEAINQTGFLGSKPASLNASMTQSINTNKKKLANFVKGLAKNPQANKSKLRSQSNTQGMRQLITRQSEALSKNAFKGDKNGMV